MRISVSPLAAPFALVGLALALFVTWNVPDALEALLIGIGIVLSAAGIMRSWLHGLQPVAAAFYMFWLAWLGIPPAVQLALQRVPWNDTAILLDRPTMLLALVLLDLALLATMLGQALGRAGHRLPAVPAAARGPVRGWVLLLLLVGLAVVAPHAISVNGGIGTFFSSRTERGQVIAAAGADVASAGGVAEALVLVLPGALAVTSALLALERILSRAPRAAWVKVLDAVALLVGLGAVAVFANPISNTRFIGVTGIGALAIALLRPRSKRAGGVFVLIGLVAVLVLYPFANNFRGDGVSDTSTVDVGTYATIDFDGFQQVINTIHYVADLGPTGGRYIASAVLFLLPRATWEGKSVPASLDVAAHANYTFTNLSEPIPAELYLEFGWAGVILGMVLVGYFIGRADRAWLERPEGKLARYVPYLSVAVLGFLRGPLGAQVPVYLTVLGLLFIALRGRPGWLLLRRNGGLRAREDAGATSRSDLAPAAEDAIGGVAPPVASGTRAVPWS